MLGSAINLVSHPSPGDLSLHYVGMAPSRGIEIETSCDELSPHLKPFNVTRQWCQGTWSITRGGIELLDGAYNGTVAKGMLQKPIVNNSVGLFPGIWYMSSFLEIIGPYANRTNSDWEIPAMATSVAAMMWSRIAAVSATDGSLKATLSGRETPLSPPEYANYTYGGDTTNSKAGLLYKLEDEVVYARPTLRKVSALYFVLAIQPVLTVLVVGLTFMFHSTPIDSGFGLISILSGVRRGSLVVLKGSSLSGKLSENVKLVIAPKHDGVKGSLEYDLRPGNERTAYNGRLQGKAVYD